VFEPSVTLRRLEPVSNNLLEFNPTVRVEVQSSLGIAHISARKGQLSVLSRRVAEYLAMDLPFSQYYAQSGGLAILGLTPTSYLVLAQESGPSRVWQWARSLSDCCAVTDQSGAFAVLRVSGVRARDVLMAGLFLDLADSAFPVGRVAAGLLGHFNVILWRLAGDGVFDLAVPRSVARELCRWLSERGRMANLS
jgi:methylglutamate dehydrogenase subunit D